MGEVYRADDLVLGQPVALKFLPEAASGNEELLTRFRNEVRTARRVSHSNVCRVYDVGTVSSMGIGKVPSISIPTAIRATRSLPGSCSLMIHPQSSPA
jgi:serine/threonine protein kinase